MITLISCLCCGVIIGWGLDLLGIVPFSVVTNIIFLNNFLVSIILGPILLGILYKRVKRWGLLYKDIIDVEQKKLSFIRTFFIWIGVVGGYVLGNIISLGLAEVPTTTISISLLPFIILILLSLFF
jgi:energy-coupling factor transport system substrate-specific component